MDQEIIVVRTLSAEYDKVIPKDPYDRQNVSLSINELLQKGRKNSPNLVLVTPSEPSLHTRELTNRVQNRFKSHIKLRDTLSLSEINPD